MGTIKRFLNLLNALFVRVAILLLLFVSNLGDIHAQNNTVFNTGWVYTDGSPTYAPGARGSRFAVDTVTFTIYENTEPTCSACWISTGERVQEITGCVAPTYTPTKHQSTIVINQCTPNPLMFKWSGTAWEQIGAGGGGGGTVFTDATIDGDGSIGDPLTISDQGASDGQLLKYNGTTWVPTWANPYVYVTATGSVTSDVNRVLIGTIVADITLGLPSCNAAANEKEFWIKKNGSDAFKVIIDPAGSETFSDGSSVKNIYNQHGAHCTCATNGGTYSWYFSIF